MLDSKQKQKILDKTQYSVKTKVEAIKAEIPKVIDNVAQAKIKVKTVKGEPHFVVMMVNLFNTLALSGEQQIEELEYLSKSPFFVRCDVKFDGNNKISTLYFARFNFIQEDIFSWIVPAAQIRFEPIGHFSFKNNEGHEVKGQLIRKD